jgi:hypothetical protein
MEHCIWKKQPETPAEVERAIAVLEGQELMCHRYAGRDPEILKRLSSTCCDYPDLSPGQTEIPNESVPAPQFAVLDAEHLLSRIWGRLTGRNKI